jgi:carbon monoxide dehydrogenase subunit G
VLLEVSKDLEVPASVEACWRLVSDVPRLSGCIPGVSDVQEIAAGREYAATVTDKLGPFRLQLPVHIRIVSAEAPRLLTAELRGDEGRGLARVQGRLEASLEPASDVTRLALSMRLDVLGRLAALGATPMRRRADDIFEMFVARVREALSGH